MARSRVPDANASMLTHSVLSQSAEYALRAVLYLAGREQHAVTVAEIARHVSASRSYLAKVLGQLASAGILESSRGAAGGFRLIVSPQTLTLARIASQFEDTGSRRCLLGSGICGDVAGCGAHELWTPVANAMNGFFSRTTVSDLLQSR